MNISSVNFIPLGGGVSGAAASGWPVSNLLKDNGARWRSTATTTTLTFTIPAMGNVGCVGLVRTNLSTTAIIKVDGYLSTNGSTVVGSVEQTPLYGWAMSSGDIQSVALWLPKKAYRKFVVTITDTDNPDGYIEAEMGFVSSYTTILTPPDGDSIKVAIIDTSSNTRTESGRLRTDVGVLYKTLSFSLRNLSTSERNAFWSLFSAGGKRSAVFVNLVPSSDDVVLTQMYSIYGKLSSSAELAYQWVGVQAVDVTLEEV